MPNADSKKDNAAAQSEKNLIEKSAAESEKQEDKTKQTTPDNEAKIHDQAPDIKPDEIVEIEQVEPEKISEEDLIKAKELEAHNLRPRIILPANKKNDAINPNEIPSPKTENKLAEHNQKKLKELTEHRKTPLPEPAKSEIPFMRAYLKKLAEFRQKANAKRREKKAKNLEIIMEYAKRKNRITNDEVEKLTGIKDRQAQRYLNLLIKQKRLARFGKTKNTFYKPIK